MSDLERIWLQPECCANPEQGRLWCEDKDPEQCEDGVPWAEYVRADLYARLRAELVTAKSELGVMGACYDTAIAERDEARAEVESLLEVLDFYADEATYHAMVIVADPPCGDFITDFSVDEGSEYERPMPGKRARAALRGEARRGEENEPC